MKDNTVLIFLGVALLIGVLLYFFKFSFSCPKTENMARIGRDTDLTKAAALRTQKVPNVRVETYQDVEMGTPTCPPLQFYNCQAGECQPMFQGSSSAKAVWSSKAVPRPEISLPGSTMPGYGVGISSPLDVPVYSDNVHVLLGF